jgi:prepilin-type processing-associated H-X9-DG protein
LAVIAVLTSLLVPGIKVARERANSTVCMNNLRQLGAGLLQYSQDHAQCLPSAWYQGQSGYMWYWSPDFTPYLGQPGLNRMKLGMCPDWDGAKKKGIAGSTIYVPNTDDSYTLCYPSPSYAAGYTVGETYSATPRILQYKQPSKNLLLCDSKPNPNSSSYSAYGLLPVTRTATRFLQQNGDDKTKPTGFRHANRMNVLFADFHFQSLSPQEVTDEMVNPEQ